MREPIISIQPLASLSLDHKSSQCHSLKSEEHKLPVGKSQRPHKKERDVFFLKINCQFKLENNYPSLGKRCCLDAFLRKGVGEMYPGFRGDAKEEAGFYFRIFCYQMYAMGKCQITVV